MALKLFISSLQLLVLFFFCSLGCFLLALPFFPELRFSLADMLLHRHELFREAGGVTLFFAVLLFLGFYLSNPTPFLSIQMGRHPVSIHKKLVRTAVEECLKTQFSKPILSTDVAILGKRRLEVELLLQPMEHRLEREFLESIDLRLTALLKERFGYAQPFSLGIRFT